MEQFGFWWRCTIYKQKIKIWSLSMITWQTWYTEREETWTILFDFRNLLTFRLKVLWIDFICRREILENFTALSEKYRALNYKCFAVGLLVGINCWLAWRFQFFLSEAIIRSCNLKMFQFYVKIENISILMFPKSKFAYKWTRWTNVVWAQAKICDKFYLLLWKFCPYQAIACEG